MKLNDYLEQKGLTRDAFYRLTKAEQRTLRKEHSDQLQAEYIAKTQESELNKRKNMVTDEQVYEGMYKHLVEASEQWPNGCSGKLQVTKRFLNKYANSEEQKARILDFVKEHGGYCDCEVIMNCPHTMQEAESEYID